MTFLSISGRYTWKKLKFWWCWQKSWYREFPGTRIFKSIRKNVEKKWKTRLPFRSWFWKYCQKLLENQNSKKRHIFVISSKAWPTCQKRPFFDKFDDQLIMICKFFDPFFLHIAAKRSKNDIFSHCAIQNVPWNTIIILWHGSHYGSHNNLTTISL